MSDSKTSSWSFFEFLLRDRESLYKAVHAGTNSRAIMQTMLLVIFVGSASFGACVGSYRGGIQIFYAALKFPLVLLGTAALCAPVLTTLEMALGQHTRFQRDLILVAAAMATGALWLMTLAPILLLGASFEVAYHQFILVIGACFAVAGIATLRVLARGLRDLSGVASAGRSVALMVVFGVVGMQMSWTLRPYVVRPRAQDIPFVRSLDGSLLEALVGSVRSANGDYSREEAPLPEGS